MTEGNEPTGKRFLIVEIETSERLSWAELAKNVKEAVDGTTGSLFFNINVAGSPDPYLLKNPDDPPKDWK